MEQRPFLVLGWFGSSITCLVFSLIFLVFISTSQTVTPSSQDFRLYSALPETNLVAEEAVSFKDARAKIVENFFKGYQSPLAQYSDLFVKVADERKLDFRLLPAISMQESNGGKRVIKDSKNPFGYGIYGDKVTRFLSWEEAIERVGRGLKEDYLDQGLKTPFQIMTKYTPPSLSKGGTWATGVNTFMSELQ